MAWAIVENDSVTRIVNTPVAVTVNGVNHPKSIFTKWHDDDLRDIGIFPYKETTVDNRYYNSGSPTYSIGATSVVGTYEGTEKDIDQLKETMISKIKSIAASTLAKTDWMVVRQYEGGTPVPSDISTYRSDVRIASNEKEAEINAMTTLAAIIAFENQEYTETRYVVTYDDDAQPVYGPETVSNERTISGVTGLWPTDPTAEEDPTFIELVKA